MNHYSPAYNVASMWEIVPDRLRKAMEKAGVNQSQLAEIVGLKQPSIGRLLTGETRTSRALDRIAEALNTSTRYLKGEGDCSDMDHFPLPGLHDTHMPLERLPFVNQDAIPAGLVERIVSDMGVVTVREVDLAIGMGATYLDQAVTDAVQYFPRAWLDLYTRAPADKLIITRGSGDSMVPTIYDQDLVLIDTTDTHPRMTDQVWAVSYCGLGSVKRLRPTKDGGWLLMSDNRDISDIAAYDDEMHVLGRVVAYFRKM